MKTGQKITIEGLYCGIQAPLLERNAQLLLHLLQAEIVGKDKSLLAKYLEEDVGCKIIENRLTNQGGRAGPAAILMASALSEGIPGRMVMWAYTLYREFKKKSTPVTLKSLCHTFGSGFPDAKAYQTMWENQKGRTHGVEVDNLLDCCLWEDLLPESTNG